MIIDMNLQIKRVILSNIIFLEWIMHFCKKLQAKRLIRA